MLSPLSMIRPRGLRVSVFTWYSSASSSTRFMYSSKPTMCPSIRRVMFSNSQTCTRERFCRYRKIRLMGCTITFCTFCGPLYDILLLLLAQTKCLEFVVCFQIWRDHAMPWKWSWVCVSDANLMRRKFNKTWKHHGNSNYFCLNIFRRWRSLFVIYWEMFCFHWRKCSGHCENFCVFSSS